MATTYPVLRWQIGDVRISRVVEAEGPTKGTFLFADATPERLLQHAWLKPHFMTDEGMLISSIVSGQMISRTGKYKRYPIIGTGIMLVALRNISAPTTTSS